MILALDVGNSQIFGGVFDKSEIKLRFRRNSKSSSSSDEHGIFLRQVLKENAIDPKLITQIGICSVVPEVVYSLMRGCEKYFSITPFVLQPGVKTGLVVKYHNPVEVGSDRIANAIAGTSIYSGKDLIIVDLGTATTFCVVTAKKDYVGGSIIAGLKLSRDALVRGTSKLPSVEILKTKGVLGQSTIESIQSGLYYGHLGQIREIAKRLTDECFEGVRPVIIGTGGLAPLFEKEKVFDAIHPDLVLQGIRGAIALNAKSPQASRVFTSQSGKVKL
jgi:type III pantothenate kinase